MDMPGAITVTAGIVTLVAALSQIEQGGWTSPVTLGLAGFSLVSLIAFIIIEKGV
ncbi:hypothetical protein [Paenibacillus tianjinensis]|uniref:hypothetical protein n=1 Tax=Paenibacillus tianjinensis TaxID=2810347 RepID=UPI001E5380CC|nr:hypothetical protein [Paenibacillus tianjinensis]